jgi:Gpi18-like mannosyltransferase
MSDAQEFHLREYILYALGAIILIVCVALRLSWYPFITSDYTYFVKQWMTILASHPGLSAFSQPFADYAPLYLYLLKILTFIPLSSLVLAKSLSFIFDIVIAMFAVLFARRVSTGSYSRGGLFLLFAIFISIPSVMLNSSLWSQSDALYAAPVIASLYFIMRDRPLLAAVLYGVAISFKLQAIFFLPILVGYLLQSKEHRLYVFIPFLMYLAFLIPVAIVGGDLSYWFLIYARQSGEYTYLSVSAPSIYAFVNNLPMTAAFQDALFWCGIVLASAWAVTVGYVMYRLRQHTASIVVLLSLASALVIPYVLPRMHERYFYLADVISCLYVVFMPRRWYLAVLIVFASTLAYMPYLSSQIPFLSGVHVDLRIPAVLLLVAIGIVVRDLIAHRTGIRSHSRAGTRANASTVSDATVRAALATSAL